MSPESLLAHVKNRKGKSLLERAVKLLLATSPPLEISALLDKLPREVTMSEIPGLLKYILNEARTLYPCERQELARRNQIVSILTEFASRE